MLENGFLSTGDLVKILGTTKNTLFHYDAMGLFSPAMVKENGYRAYSYRQLETFRAISSLRELGMARPRDQRLHAKSEPRTPLPSSSDSIVRYSRRNHKASAD